MIARPKHGFMHKPSRDGHKSITEAGDRISVDGDGSADVADRLDKRLV